MFFAISAIPLLQRNSDWLPTEIPNTYNTYHHTLVRTVTLHIVINRKGEIIIPLEYDTNSYLTYFQEPGLAILIKNAHNVVNHIQNKPSHEF